MLVDLAIIGPGVLGSLVAEQYRSVNPSATIALVFRSHDAERRDRLDIIIHSKSCSSCSLNSADDLEFSAEKLSENAKIINFEK